MHTVFENVEFPLLLQGIETSKRKKMVLDALEWVGLTEKINSKPAQLSGGESQRVAIARAMVKKPAIVLADEPTANLDTTNGKQEMDIMIKLNTETGVTFVFATHDPRVISYASRVVTLQDGLIEKDTSS